MRIGGKRAAIGGFGFGKLLLAIKDDSEDLLRGGVRGIAAQLIVQHLLGGSEIAALQGGYGIRNEVVVLCSAGCGGKHQRRQCGQENAGKQHFNDKRGKYMPWCL